MSNIPRKLRFGAKVKIEREILSLINTSTLSAERQLAGMTKEAVLTWEKKLNGLVNHDTLTKAVEKTIEISRNAHIVSDTSRTVFAEGKYFDDDRYQQDKNQLKQILIDNSDN